MPSVCFVDATCWAPVCELVNPMFSVFVTVGAVVAVLGAVDGVAVPPHAAASSPAAVASALICRMALIGTLLFPQPCAGGGAARGRHCDSSTVDTGTLACAVRPFSCSIGAQGGGDGDDASGQGDLER